MIIFIDESGIHKTKDHSCFALVYVEVSNLKEIENEILRIENKLGILFHWSHTVWEVKKKFFEGIAKLDFSVKIAIIQNPIHAQLEFEEALRHLIIEKHIQQIIIDGKKPRSYERKIKSIIREKGLSVKKLKTVNDESFPGIRLADAIAGAVRAYYDEPNGKKQELFNMIKGKIRVVLQK